MRACPVCSRSSAERRAAKEAQTSALTAAQVFGTLWGDVKKLARNRDFVLLSIGFGLGLGRSSV